MPNQGCSRAFFRRRHAGGTVARRQLMATATERRTSVLLVEDEPMVSALAVEALLEQGFDVLPVSNASEALRFLMSEAPIDVLFTDIDIVGGMDGATLAQ